jgi:hypothetical protein
MIDPSKPLLTVEDVAAWARSTPNALYMQRLRSEPPGSLARKVGRRLLWRSEDLEEWLANQSSGGDAA